MHALLRHYLPLILGIALGATAMAQTLPRDDYKMEKEKISVNHRAAKQACKSLTDNAEDICHAQAHGQEKVSESELEYRNKPTQANHTKILFHKAEAEYSIAKERCDDKTGNMKDVCVKEAKAAEITAKADARAEEKTSDANTTARAKRAAARSEAAEEKSEAQFRVAKEKCDAYSNLTKDKCLNDAHNRFGKK